MQQGVCPADPIAGSGTVPGELQVPGCSTPRRPFCAEGWLASQDGGAGGPALGTRPVWRRGCGRRSTTSPITLGVRSSDARHVAAPGIPGCVVNPGVQSGRRGPLAQRAPCGAGLGLGRQVSSSPRSACSGVSSGWTFTTLSASPLPRLGRPGALPGDRESRRGDELIQSGSSRLRRSSKGLS